MKKRFALTASEREKECDHEHMAWTGSIPCTGTFACTMCGMTKGEITAEREAQMLNDAHTS